MRTTEKMSRREWLRRSVFYGTAGGALAILGGILADVWIAAGRFSPSRWSEVATVDALPAGAVAPFYDSKLALVRREGRLAALSLECTHLGCLVTAAQEGFFCPCHGSHFGPLGEVYSGPARTALKWHPLQVRRGRIWVHAGRKSDEAHWVDLRGKEGGRS